MNDTVALIRTASEMETALVEIEALRLRLPKVRAAGDRHYNPGWHLALDLRNMLTVSESVAKAALERTESRGGHTRDDYPATDPEWGKINLIVSLDDAGKVAVKHQPLPVMPPELAELLEAK